MKKVILVGLVLLALLLVVPMVGAQELGVEPVSEPQTSLQVQAGVWAIQALFVLVGLGAIGRNFIELAKRPVDGFINWIGGLVGEKYSYGLLRQFPELRAFLIVIVLFIAGWQWVEANSYTLFTGAPEFIVDGITLEWQRVISVIAFVGVTTLIHHSDYFSWIRFDLPTNSTDA